MGGAVIWSRQTLESDIFFYKPDKWFKIWFFLVLKANHKDNKLFKRGQCLITYEQIMQATKASKTQVHKCLKFLKLDNMIETHKTTRGSIITICNYNEYQTLDNYKTTSKTTGKTTRRQLGDNSEATTINKNVKNDKNDKYIKRETNSLTPSQEMKSFCLKEKIFNDLMECFENDGYEKNNLRAEFDKFINYWSELSLDGKKQRWQKEKTFEVKRRLGTWLKRSKEYKQNNYQVEVI